VQAGLGQSVARQAAIFADVPVKSGAVTINKVCGSGLKSIIFADQAIRAGDISAAVVGGTEAMTRAPYLSPQARAGARLGDVKLVDSLVNDGLWDIYNDFHMGMTGELVAEKFKISRGEMDAYSADSHTKAAAAIKAGKFRKEIVPVELKGRKGEKTLFETDEGVREGTTAESLGKLKPVFKKDGVVTAGNASQLSDGAAALVVVSEEEMKRQKLTPLARITGHAFSGLEPKWVMMTPVDALKNLEKKCGVKASEADLIEANEAFASQACAVMKEAKLDPEKVNVHGGAVALGHPIGCSGARIVVTLIHALQDRKLRKGIATLCMGGANGLAMGIELC
ncbi:MAG: acetyl-CoA C-acyltransferase, partial [Planctomycetota bacterium]|jgi:acetyl-CoA C-acetyltransferase